MAGTGPYVVQELVTDDHLTLTKNENYWNGSPKLDKLTIRITSDGRHPVGGPAGREHRRGLRHGL